MGDTRRGFLRRGLLGGALLAGIGAASALGLSLWPTARRTPRRPLLVLDETELSILAAMAEAIAPGADGLEIAHRADAFLVAQGDLPLRDLRRLLRLVESGAVGAILDGRPRPFTRLDVEGRAAALRAMRDSRLALRRGGYQVLRRLLLSARWTDPAAWPALGYVGPPQLGAPT